MLTSVATHDAAAHGPLVRVRELWAFREVIRNFVAQDLKVKYRRSTLGFFWSLLNPLLQLAVTSLVFSLMFKMSNMTLYILSGLIPWTFFASTVDQCSMSIVGAESMLRRQYFPKLVFPLSIVIQNLITFVLSLLVLLILLGWRIGFHPSPALLILPLSFACILCTALGLGAIAAVMTVHFRDIQHLIAVFMSAWFYLTPIIYPLDGGLIPHPYRIYFKLNPVFAIIEMFHRPIYHAMLPTTPELITAVGTAIFSLVIGLTVFWRNEDSLVFAL